VAVDKSGTVYFDSLDGRVRKVTPDGIIHLVAGGGTGSGLFWSGGDGGPAVNATLLEPKGLAIDAQGNVYIGDTSNARLRKVDTNGIITTIAGPAYWARTIGTPWRSIRRGICTSPSPTPGY
jgi:hypothetical protein